LLIIVLASGCAGGGSDDDLKRRGPGADCTPPDPTTISFSANVQPIFDGSCALGGCHAGGVPAGDLTLTAGASRGELVDVPAAQIPSRRRVVPGDADASYLIQKIEGTPGIFGQLMPLGCPDAPEGGATCLDANQMAAIRTWVEECALAN